MNTANLYASASTLCSMAAEGQEDTPAGAAQGTAVGGVQRIEVKSGEAEDAARIAAEGSSGAQPNEAAGGEGERPGGLPEGFDTVEAFVAAVNDGSYTPPAAEGEVKAAPGADQALPGADDPRLQPFTEEFTKSGDLSAESVAKAAKDLNVPEVLVRAYVDMLKTQGQATVTVEAAPFHEAVGGSKAWSAFQEWTTQEGNLPEATEKAYITLTEQGKTAEALAVIQPTISAWKAAGGGTAPRDVTTAGSGGAKEGNEGDVYAEWSEVEADMNNPKYQSSATFRKEVEAKIARSPSI